MAAINIFKIIEKVHTLPPLPLAVQKLYSLAGNQNSNIKEMADIITNDQALTAKILRIVNSAFYGLSQKVGSVLQALMILGFNEVKNLALSLSVMKFGKNIGSNNLLKLDEFWKHSISVGISSKLLAKRFHFSDSETTFVSGLLHDIGKLVFLEHFSKEYIPLLEIAKKNEKTLFWLEKDFFKINHAEVGYELCKYWKLPPVICNSIRKHHENLIPDKNSDDSLKIQFLVKAGNNIAKVAHIGISGDSTIEDSVFASTIFPLSAEDIKNILLQLQEEVDKVTHSFELKG